MLFSAHVADTGVVGGMRRLAPKARDVPGLRSARGGTCAQFGAGLMPHPQPGRKAMVACWDDEASLDRFLKDTPLGQRFSAGWSVRMDMFRAVGVWPGIGDDMNEVAAANPAPVTGPTVALTIGTLHVRKAVPFLRVSAKLEEQFLQTPTALWGTAITNGAQRLIGTLTVWESPTAAEDYMRNGAHKAAVDEHFDYSRDPTGHAFSTGGGFFGFRPTKVSGSLGGPNPTPPVPIAS